MSTAPESSPKSAVPPNRASTGRPGMDETGRYRAWGRVSYTIVGVYLFLLLLLVVFVYPDSASLVWWAPWVLSVFLLLSLARYLSTNYSIDDVQLRARRLFGGFRVRLDQVRRIEYASLRDLSPTGGILGSWGWRGRMWSPVIGRFSSIHTDAANGLLITSSDDSLYVSPRDPVGFARELSRRVRSYSGRLAVDVGDPGAPAGPLKI